MCLSGTISEILSLIYTNLNGSYDPKCAPFEDNPSCVG